MGNLELLVLAIILLVTALMYLAVRQLRSGQRFPLRDLGAYATFRRQVDLAVESGRHPHVTLGRGGLQTIYGPTSVAALEMLQHVGQVNGRSGIAARATVGDATLLPVVQDQLRSAYGRADRRVTIGFEDVQFLADAAFPFVYAAGVSEAMEREETGNSVIAGHFGTEIALIAEAAQRNDLGQVFATDDPLAMALATAASPDVLWGEELFAAGAYLQAEPIQVASVRAQDMTRWLLAALILGLAFFRLLGL
jgi:hypothetical protein